ncbi:MAG: hypothetical protein AAF587_01190 [Bacteroidota bacterium]
MFCIGSRPFPLIPPKTDHLESWEASLKEEYAYNCLKVVDNSMIFTEKWDTLVQPAFWRNAMDLSPDSLIINIAKTRQVIGYIPYKHWRGMSERKLRSYEDSIRQAYQLGKKDEIYFTNGRSHFYQFHKVLPEISRAVEVFHAEGVDPWYAQTILLIESPGRLQFSTEGAYGAFQLMEGVAKEVGLVINDTLDEREDFEKSAVGAARLIQRTCIPKAKVLADHWQLEYKEDDLWFRLLVLHVYHAGFGNVRRVLRKIRPTEGGIPLFLQLWQTKGRRFGNASQNYSQIALASLMELEEIIQEEVILCPDDWQAQITD